MMIFLQFLTSNLNIQHQTSRNANFSLAKMVWIYTFIFTVVLFFFHIGISFANSYPSPTGYVNDFANLYSAEFKSGLEQDLASYEQSTGIEVAVATIESLDGSDIEGYAVELFEQWKIGKKESDNGLLLLISKNDRQVKIEVGYGLEEKITDGRAGEIIRTAIIPEFKNNDYEKGTLQAVEKLKAYAGGDRAPPGESFPSENVGDFPIVPILIGGYFLFTYLASFLGRSKSIWPGAVIGGAVGGIGGLIFWSFAGLLAGAVFTGLIGLFLDWLLSRNYKQRVSHGLPTGFWSSRGGFSSGSGFGGGFGGFGGGRSGGGGASGRW